MRKLTAFFLLGLLVCAAWAQDSDDSADESLDRSDSYDSAVSEADSEPTPAPEATPPPAPQPTPPPPKAAKISVGPVKATVYTADGKRAAVRDGALGDKLFEGDKLGTGQSVELVFTPQLSGDAFKPQQAMLMASSKAAGGLAAYAVAKVKKDSTHTLTLSTSAVEKQIANVGGELELTLLLGDPSVAVGVSAPLGSIVLPEGASGGPAKPKLLTARHQPLNNAKPTIAHAFRPPASRGPVVVSLAFTGLALAPLAALIVYLGVLGVNLKGLPTGAANLWVLLFHGGILALLGLYLLFWLQLNLAQTIPLALGLGLFIAATGFKALSALSEQRLAAEKDGSPAAVAKKTN